MVISFGSSVLLDRVTCELRSNDGKGSVMERGKGKVHETSMNLAFFLFP